MLFRRKIPKSCVYCAYSAKLEGQQLLCAKCGVVRAEGQCRRFRYDPCKRIPVKPKALDFDQYENEDYTL